MRVSLSWLKDFVKIPETLNAKELGRRFTLSCAEVEKVEESGSHLEKIKVVEIVDIEKHPDAVTLNLVTFKLSEKESFRVVCGAPNVKKGLKVPYAPLGTTFPDGLTLEPKKIRGIISEGMLCSEEELGLSNDSHGLMELSSDAPLGVTLASYLKKTSDVIFEIDNKSLTHRPDLWCHFGIAREFAAIFETPLMDLYDAAWEKKLEGLIKEHQLAKDSDLSSISPLNVVVEDGTSCLGYLGLMVTNVEVKDSPSWMCERLLAVGLRPINNIVDISNYVMCELGIPTHMFDRDEIFGDKIIVRCAKDKEVVQTLDEVERTLVASDTVISDSKKALVVAGIMGGLSSGVSSKTKTVFIEAANWKDALVRRTSTRLGLRTDSSQRYEKNLDSTLLKKTLYRSLELLLELCPNAKMVSDVKEAGFLQEKAPLIIETSIEKISSVLGCRVSEERVISILNSLSFSVSKMINGCLSIKVPSFRATKDIEYVDDIIEEIGRIIGYDNIEAKAPKLDVKVAALGPEQKLAYEIRNFLVYHASASEIMTYPMVGEKLLSEMDFSDPTCFKIINALSDETSLMRKSLIPSMLKSVMLNQKYYDKFLTFELGRVYLEDKVDFYKERNQLIIASYSEEEKTFMSLLNLLESLMKATNIQGDFIQEGEKYKNPFLASAWKGKHPFEFLNIRVMGRIMGFVTSVHPTFLKSLKIKGYLSLCVLDLADFESRELKSKIKYQAPAKFPSSEFDWTIVVSKEKQIGPILSNLAKTKIDHLLDIKIVDVFNLSETQNALTLRAKFLNKEATLNGDFLEAAQKLLVEECQKAGYSLKA